ncbi:MAG: hypothetical protein FWC71_06335 [Defluviitaleaceae bacterium]|nr:hypothetical protein [Defluviitaleaceae bacterium]
MKKLLFVAIIIAVIITITACAYETTAYNYANDERSFSEMSVDDEYIIDKETNSEPTGANAFEGFRLYIPADSVTPTGVRLSMINNTERNISHGTMFHVERYEDGTWARIPYVNSVAWTLPLLSIQAQATIHSDIGWEFMYGELTPGKYRVVRTFSIGWNADPSAGRNFFAIFHISDEWQETHDSWLAEQDALAEIAFGRFAHLDIMITNHNRHGLDFTLTNNNPHYAYYINMIFMGWEEIHPEGRRSAGLEYMIFNHWEANDPKHLAVGESLSMTVNWYDEIGCITNIHRWQTINPYLWQLVIDVQLDVDEAYIHEHFRHNVPGAPGQGHRLYAEFEIA